MFTLKWNGYWHRAANKLLLNIYIISHDFKTFFPLELILNTIRTNRWYITCSIKFLYDISRTFSVFSYRHIDRIKTVSQNFLACCLNMVTDILWANKGWVSTDLIVELWIRLIHTSIKSCFYFYFWRMLFFLLLTTIHNDMQFHKSFLFQFFNLNKGT